jgi:hypothetical protein
MAERNTPCANIVGVKNIIVTFTNCADKSVLGPFVHKLAKDELPKWRAFDHVYEKLPGGFIKMKQSSYEVDISLIRDLRVPLSYYQGRAALDIQVEYENGLVYTGPAGGVTSEDLSDTHEVMIKAVFETLDELLPPGALAS